MSYRIRTLEQLTGLSRNTITAWERRYHLLAPGKDASGYRAYSEADVELLLRVRALLDRGLQIGEVVERVRADRAVVAPLALAGLRGALVERLQAFDGGGADEVAASLGEMSFRRRLDEVYLPAVRDIGTRWSSGACSIAQEHFASAWVREQLVAMSKALEDGPRDGPRAVCAGFPGEQHELGLLAVAIHLALRGHRVVYLGANLPTEELVAVVRARPTSLVGVSVVAEGDVDAIVAAASQLRDAVPAETRVVYGGPAVAALADRSTDGLAFCPRWDDLVERWSAARARRGAEDHDASDGAG